MNRYFQVFPVLILAGLGLSHPALAGVPDPALSTVPDVVAAPGGVLAYRVTIVGSAGPIGGAHVELRYSPAAEAAACWCTVQPHPIIQATTDGSGVATFNVQGGGCLNPGTIPGGVAVQVFVNDILLKEVGQVSPDVVSTTQAPCTVSLSDAVNFTGPLAAGSYSFCYDLNHDLAVGLADGVIFTSVAAGAATCN